MKHYDAYPFMISFTNKIAEATAIPVNMLLGKSMYDGVSDDLKYLLEKFEGKNPSIEEIQKALQNKIKDKLNDASHYWNTVSEIYGISRKQNETDNQLRKRLSESIRNKASMNRQNNEHLNNW